MLVRNVSKHIRQINLPSDRHWKRVKFLGVMPAASLTKPSISLNNGIDSKTVSAIASVSDFARWILCRIHTKLSSETQNKQHKTRSDDTYVCGTHGLPGSFRTAFTDLEPVPC